MTNFIKLKTPTCNWYINFIYFRKMFEYKCHKKNNVKKYFVIIENERKGPLSFSELELMSLDNNTPIWYEGINEWTVLEKVDEFKLLRNKIPPPFNTVNNVTNPPIFIKENNYENEESSFFEKYKIHLLLLILIVTAFVILFSTFNTSNKIIKTDEAINEVIENTNNNGDNSTEQKELSPEELRKKLLIKEQKNPLKYLSVSAIYKENNVQTRNGTFFRSSKWELDGY